MKIIALTLWIACVSSFAQTNWGTITLVNSAGVRIVNARVLSVSSGKVMYVSDSGGGTVALADLPPDLQRRFGYSPDQDDSNVAIRKWTRMLAAPGTEGLSEVKTNADRGNISAMIALGDFFHAKWKADFDNAFANFDFQKPGALDPHTGLPVTILHATNSEHYLEGMRWYEKAATLHNKNAMWRIITNEIEDGIGGFSLDPERGLISVGNEGLRWLKTLAAQGDQRAEKNLESYSTNFNSVFEKTGLAIPSSSSNSDSTFLSTPKVPAPAVPALEILDIRAKVVETTDQWWKWSYQLKVRNNSLEPIDDYSNVQFIDADGFIIDKCLCKVSLGVGETKTFLDTHLVSLPGASQVKTVKAE